MNKFLEIESVPNATTLSIDDQKVENFYLQATKRNCDGRYIVNLPYKKDRILGNSRNQAKQRFFSLEERFRDNPKFRNQCINFIREYQDLGHVQLVPNYEFSKPTSECFYLPHFGIIREESETTKLRVVFDASAKSEAGISLNDVLHFGPKLQEELFNVLLKFRCYPVALTSDIEKMFRQIQIEPEWFREKAFAFQ
nr:uncharacterized protein LOC107437918 [Parasteatoda tepidariorum]